ncbi:MAG TPA: Sec-independent protein translocase protein TatB [Stellaceae bacterium]|nr:Sec-independent protein translocase protein TatB [Stellaceae bacterium]
MFFDIGWPEFMLIGIVALIVIGPKDLPAALRVAGYWVRKARTLSREFHSSVEQMMREVELHEVQNELRKATEINLDQEFNKIIDPAKDPAAGPQAAIPDHFDTAPAPVIEESVAMIEPVPPIVEPVEPELPLTIPVTLPHVPEAAPASEPEPLRAVEPSKP